MQPKERRELGANSTEGCRGIYGATGSLSWACTKTMSRPLRAVCRRLLGVSEAVGSIAVVESVMCRTTLWGLGWVYNQGADALNDNGKFLYGWDERGYCRLAPTIEGSEAARH